MAKETTIITSLIEEKFPPVYATQYDSGREIIFFLLDKVGEEKAPIDLTGNIISLIVETQSKIKVPVLGEVIDGPSGGCKVQLTKAATAEIGTNSAQLILTGPNGTIKSREFDLKVERAIDSGDIITKSEDFTVLETLVRQLNGELAEISSLHDLDATLAAAYEVYVEEGGSLPIDEWLAGFTGEPGPGVPAGGTPGQILCKQGYSDYDAVWGDPLAGGIEIDLSAYSIGVGTIKTTDGKDNTGTTRLRTQQPFYVYAGTRVSFKNANSAHTLTLHIYDVTQNPQNDSGYDWIGFVSNVTDYTIDHDCYVRFVFLNGDTNVTAATYEEFLSSLTILSPKQPLQQPDGPALPYFGKKLRDTAAAVGAESGLKLAVFTDIHCYYPMNAKPFHLGWGHLRNIKALSERTHVDAVVSLGDLTNGYNPKSSTTDTHGIISKWSKSLPAPYLQCEGNHDTNDRYAFGGSGRFGELLTPQELASFYYHPNDVYHRQYFYHDIPEHKTRIIVLNANDAYVLDGNGNPKYNKEETVNGGAEAVYAFMPQQVEWLAQLLHDTERDCAGWDIVVCSHQSVCPTGSGSTQVPKNAELIWGLLVAFNSGEDFAEATGPYGDDFACEVSEEYTGVCSIACTLYGHKHYDRAFQEDGIWNICIASSLCVESNKSDGDSTVPTRTPYTVTEDAWDVVCVTPEKVKLIRFGAGNDRELNR